MLYFMKDYVKIETIDEKNSIITIQCPSELADDLLHLVDYLAHASRWVKTQIRVSRASELVKIRKSIEAGRLLVS
jgi:hypothetical protein